MFSSEAFSISNFNLKMMSNDDISGILNVQLKLFSLIKLLSASNETNKSKKNNNRNGQNRVRHELDAQGLVPLPAATCFYCRKSCKKAPLISCDYCPLFFHQVKEPTTNLHISHFQTVIVAVAVKV